MSEAPRYFDIPAAAAYVVSLGMKGVRPYTIRHAISNSRLVHTRVGKKFFVSKAAIEAWLQRAERKTR